MSSTATLAEISCRRSRNGKPLSSSAKRCSMSPYLKLYLANGAYYRLASAGGFANPDQRIADDARASTASALSFLLVAFNSTLTVVAFAGVIVSISPLPSVVTVL